MSLAAELGILSTVELLKAAARAANASSAAGVLITDYKGNVRITAVSGNITAGDADSTYTTTIQHSDVDTAANYVNVNTTLYPVTAASNVATIAYVDVPVRELKAYVRVIANIAGANSPSFPHSVTLTGVKQVR